MAFHPDSLPDLTGRVYIVTGGNSGIGYYTVVHLAKHGAHVYMGVRSPSKGAEAIANIKKMHPSANVDLLQMDLKDLSSVVAAAKRFLDLQTALHGLVNNAGVMATPFEITKDGHEGQWQTNYLSHWVLTEHLLPVLLRTAGTQPRGAVRVVNVASSGHLMGPKDGIHLADPSLKDSSPWLRYGQSKLGNILHARTLHLRYGPGSAPAAGGEIWTASIHPGVIETNLVAGVDGSAGGGVLGVAAVFRVLGLVWPADKGSWNNVFCAASPDMTAEQSGTYVEIYKRCGEPRWMSGPAKDEKLAERLEEWTRETMKREGWVE
ncbi:NAD(P)-binding protein [Hypoxylon sp. FL1284]|nr:NAD(P)-binding protein [Hypoxylon sp. FL1284]